MNRTNVFLKHFALHNFVERGIDFHNLQNKTIYRIG